MSNTRATAALPLMLVLASTLAAQNFVDVTASAGLSLPYLPGGPEEVHDRVAGMSVIDYDGDGWEDVFWMGGGIIPNRLYRNNGDGTFTDTAPSLGLDISMPGAFASWHDYDNDYDLDVLFLTFTPWSYEGGPTMMQDKLFRNDGTTFTDVTPASLLFTGLSAAGWGDLDGDGYIDLATASWTLTPETYPTKFFLKAQNNLPDFTDITPANVTTDYIWGFAPTIIDFDDDGDNDILMVADFDTSRIWRNDGGGVFTDVSDLWGPLDDDNGMGTAVGDVDNDGDPDWFLSSTYIPDGVAPPSWYPKSGNRLWLNDGNGFLTDVTETAGVREGGWGWSAMFADWDNDGDLDLAHVNGYYVDNVAVEPYVEFDLLRMFRNNGDLTFTEVSASLGVVDVDQGRGLVFFDYDHDDDLDMIVSNNDVGLTLYENQLSGVGSQIVVELRSNTAISKYGTNAKIVMTGAGLPTQTRWILNRSNYAAQEPLSAHFGAGSATTANFKVFWPSGLVTQHDNIDVDQRVVLSDDDPQTWADLGSGLAGTGGVTPTLSGVGDLSPLSNNQLDLGAMLPGTSTYLFVGLSTIDAPFKGGTLVPAPLIPPIQLPTLGGSLSLPFTWPSGVPAGIDLFFQHWVEDLGGPKSLSASNALRGTSG